MSDIFHEVEEDVRRERFEKLWKQYGDYAVAALAVVILAIAGFKFWQRYDQQQRENASSALLAAQQVLASGDSAQAAAAYANIAKTAPGGYAEIAQLSAADALQAAGNNADALALYKKIADGSTPLAPVARLRAAWIMVETAPRADVEAELAALNDNASAWRFPAREVLAYSDYRHGANAQAESAFAALAADTNASEGVRGRAKAMAAFLRSGGDRSFGNVPLPAPAAPAAPKGQP